MLPLVPHSSRATSRWGARLGPPRWTATPPECQAMAASLWAPPRGPAIGPLEAHPRSGPYQPLLPRKPSP
jgi:hypothetical protein